VDAVTPRDRSPSWEEFSEMLAEVLPESAENLKPEMLLIDDLGADSVALAEIVAFLVLDCGVMSVTEELESRDWTVVTAGQLYQECFTGAPGE
jgi:acyl carrier protein